jgi:hypothetical protein
MTAARRNLTPAEELYLTTQVSGCCPLCATPVFRKKGKSSFKHYEVAHIYPLNPTAQEAVLLANEERLNADPNHIDNLIPLCLPCHGNFDKPRTVEEYRELVKKKKELIAESNQRSLQVQYRVEEDIADVIHELYAIEASDDLDLQLSPKDLASKLDASMTTLTQHKIRRNVSDYFFSVRKRFTELEREAPTTGSLIAAQIRAFYFAQKKLGLSQQQIFSNVVSWLLSKTHPSKLDAVEIIAAFFVQNCEIFE